MVAPKIPPTGKLKSRPIDTEQELAPPQKPKQEKTPSPPKDFKKKYPPTKTSSRMWAAAPSKTSLKTLGEETTTLQKNPKGQIIYWKGKLPLPLPNVNPETFSQQELQKGLAQFLITNRNLLDFYGVQKPPLLLAKTPNIFEKSDGGQMYVVRFFQYCPISTSEGIPIDGGDLVVSGSLNPKPQKTGVDGTIESIGGVYYSCPPEKLLDPFRKKDRVLLEQEMREKLVQKYLKTHPSEKRDSLETKPLGFSLMDDQGTFHLVYGMMIENKAYFERL
ncbi:MAG: hypothetical protein A2W61_05920 [Deltaproteobacteria bacterium RIFCSPLOWO2_01_44_7]|nr:MAG: hypothetical protein A2712_04020 [Deltaproteobacteria bacterium RIFCSPHIGHO2_01_FULL_43_49]OGQ16351.1 MAG: hypothetical protein A3D22_01990 [Deltaproteobacteria bacterium RIFCSPHIGHO2_02_FULL_44_53]OGQ29312.1 MAG: hypothetical protein A3D98_05775 [Deltaproteobacteria bacterium RIFCSPHIGHO2_12_FULL_44_21]OGQ32869.1 MAG: hypothetical protein A2979_09920 [Deltaproteobacteria bacterium RIFCSPLOWO2_01_FULL_45_74]OGQ41970.1 MAG: hypothetical protein A3I70_09705 [Deltaproteobacteria bacterium 